MEPFDLLLKVGAFLSYVVAAGIIVNYVVRRLFWRRPVLKRFELLVNEFLDYWRNYKTNARRYLKICTYNLRVLMVSKYAEILDFCNRRENSKALSNKAVNDTLDSLAKFMDAFSRTEPGDKLPDRCDITWYKRNLDKGNKLVKSVENALKRLPRF